MVALPLSLRQGRFNIFRQAPGSSERKEHDGRRNKRIDD